MAKKAWTLREYGILSMTIKMVDFELFDRLKEDLRDFLIDSLNKEGLLLSRFVKSNFMSGRPGAGKRTGALQKSTVPIPAYWMGQDVVGGTSIGSGVPYANMVVGPAGKLTVIRPKSGTKIAVPLYSTLTSTGKLPARFQGPLRANAKLFRPRGTGPNSHLIFEKMSKGKVVPRFVLKDSVTVSAKVHPEQIVSIMAPEVIGRVNERINKFIKGQTK